VLKDARLDAQVLATALAVMDTSVRKFRPESQER
jgi:hypothetical protein